MELENKIKQKLRLRGFTEKQLLNNRGLIGATIDEVKLMLGKNLAIQDVSGMLPNDFKQLPEKLQCKLVTKHTHAELVDGEKIVYKEQDVLDIIKYVSEGNYR